MITFLDTEIIREKFWAIIMLLTFDPESMKELIIGASLAIVVMSIILAKMHGLGGSGSNSILVGFFVTVVGIFGMICCVVMVDELLLPLMAKEYRGSAYKAGMIVPFFILVMPLTKILFRSSYTTGVGAWAVSIFVGGAILMGVDYAYTEKDKVAPSVKLIKEYTEELNNQLVVPKESEKPAPITDPAPDPVP